MFEFQKRKKALIVIALLFIFAVSVLPAIRSGVYLGHDLPFHLGRIQSISEELARGQFPVRYESSAWQGHGYISSLMYGNIFLYIPAILVTIGLPVWRAYNIYVLLVNALTVLVSYFCFTKISKSELSGLLSTLIYCLAGYRLSNLYVRAALGEYTAMIFIPVVVYGIHKIIAEEQAGEPLIKKILPLIIGATGLIQSHILSTELVALFVLVYLLFNIKKTVLNIKELITSAILILLVNGFFLLPFVDSYSSMDLYVNSEMTAESIRGDGLYLSQLISPLTEGFGGSYVWSTAEEGYLQAGGLVIIAVLLTVITVIMTFKKLEVNKRKDILILSIFGIFAAWMSTVYFPWDLFAGNSGIAKLVSSVQYPWRYQLIAVVCFILVGAYGFEILCKGKSEKIKWASLICIFVVALGTSGYFYYTLSWKNPTVCNERADENWADKLYLPVGTDRELLLGTDIEFSGDNVVLPVLAYDNVHLTDSKGNEITWTKGHNNCVEISKADYTSDINVKYKEPLMWRVAEVISLVTIVGIIIYYFRKISRK